MTNNKRDLDFIAASKARRALNRRACAAGLSGAALRVWVIVSDYTLGYCRVSDALTHGRIAEETGLTRRSVSRALAEVAEAGLIRYRAGVGDPTQGRNAFSRITVVMPLSEPEEGDDHMVPSRDDGMVLSEGTGLSTNRERATREDNRERATREDNRGVGVESVAQVQFARGEEPPTPAPDLQEPSTALVQCSSVEASNEEHPEPEWDGDLDSLNDWLEEVYPSAPEPTPASRPIGAATGTQAVERFAAETGLPLSKRTRKVLSTSLDEVAATVSPNELLCALGYWREKRGGKWPEDASERVGEAMAYEHGCLIDPVNAMTPAGAIQEGRCRAKMALLPRQEREAAEADPGFRMKGFGLDWPAPLSPLGLLPDARQHDMDEADPFSIPMSQWRQALAPVGRP